MTRTWTRIASDYNGTPQQRAALSTVFDSLEWTKVPTDPAVKLSIPMCPGLAINEAIRELRLPKVSDIAWNGVLPNEEGGCYGVYGIRCHYKNGMVEAFLLDIGTEVLVLASDLHSEGRVTVLAPSGHKSPDERSRERAAQATHNAFRRANDQG